MRYANLYKKQYIKNTKEYGKEKALEIWHKRKAELLEEKVFNKVTINQIVNIMKGK